MDPLLDSYQKRAIESNRNAVVTAGAGSGKTRVLVEKFVRLVTTKKAGVDEILTLTFTRKAAAEMRERIYQNLLTSGNGSGIEAQLSGFNLAQVSTIDSFCAHIVRNWSTKFGITPDFSIDEGEARKAVERVAFEFLLETPENADLNIFIQANGFENCVQNLLVSLAENHFSVAGRLDLEEMCRKQHGFLESALATSLHTMEVLTVDVEGLDDSAGKSIITAKVALGSVKNLRSLYDESDYGQMHDLCAGVSLRSPNGKSLELQRLKTLVKDLKQVLGDAAAIAASLASWQITASVFAALGTFQDRALERRSSSGVLFYHDVIEMAVAILQENSEIRSYYKKKYKYILIDEFQDNNLIQKKLLFFLAERLDLQLKSVPDATQLQPGKLFFVGDEKQSIYQFRGADVSVLKGLSNEITSAGGESLVLPKNYRSEPAIIATVNHLFAGIMGDATELYEAEFHPLEDNGAKISTIPVVQVLFKPFQEKTGGEMADNVDAEAWALAEFIRNAVGSLEVDDQGSCRAANFGDFALLLRSTGNQIRYERAFRHFEIPFSVQNARSLFVEAPVNDLYSALQLALYPQDRVAFAAFLRSPFVLLSDEGFVRVLMTGLMDFTPPEGIGENDAKRLGQAKELIGWIRERIDHITIGELIHHLWHSKGYRHSLLAEPSQRAYLEHYEYLRFLAAGFDKSGGSFFSFLDALRPLLGKYERAPDLDLPETRGDRVQIMTIHKAKGLEFPIVIVADAGNRGKNSGLSLPYYYSHTHGVTLNVASSHTVNWFYSQGKGEAAKKEHAELKRLLYVACTRARNHLIISGCHNKTNRKNTNSLLNLTLRGLGWRESQDVFAIPDLQGLISKIADVPKDHLYRSVRRKGAADRETLRQIYGKAIPIVREEQKKEWTSTEIEALLYTPSSEVEPLPELECDPLIAGDNREKDYGVLCHYVLQEIILDRYDRMMIPARLLQNFTESTRQVLIQDAERLGGLFKNSEFMKRKKLIKPPELEVPFLLRIEAPERDMIVAGQIDMLLYTSEGIDVVDFKSDRVIRRGEYYHQMQTYIQAVQEWTDGRVGCFLYYLRGSRVINVPQMPTDMLADFLGSERAATSE